MPRRRPDFPAEIALVISNIETRAGLGSRARRAFRPKSFRTRISPRARNSTRAIDAALREAKIELVCEAGFMRIHSGWFAKRWEGRLLNIHPSLLPRFKGISVHQQALDAGVKVSRLHGAFRRAGTR